MSAWSTDPRQFHRAGSTGVWPFYSMNIHAFELDLLAEFFSLLDVDISNMTKDPEHGSFHLTKQVDDYDRAQMGKATVDGTTV